MGTKGRGRRVKSCNQEAEKTHGIIGAGFLTKHTTRLATRLSLIESFACAHFVCRFFFRWNFSHIKTLCLLLNASVMCLFNAFE